MPNYNYTHTTGEIIDFCLTATRTIELEKKHCKSVYELMRDFDKLSIAFDIVAPALKEGTEDERYSKAVLIYEELVESGKALIDYQLLIMDILCTGGFIPADRVILYKQLVETQNSVLTATGAEPEKKGE